MIGATASERTWRAVTLIGEVKSRITLPVSNKTLFVKAVWRDWSSSHDDACPPN